MKLPGAVSMTLSFVAAALIATLAGSIVQTQINLAAISALGPEISVPVRLRTTLADLLGFTPLYGALVTAALLGALPLAALAAHCRPHWSRWLFPLAAALGLWAALRVADALAPMPTLIAATRHAPGLIAMLLTAALGGWCYERIRCASAWRSIRG